MASTIISRTPSGAGNRKTWTYSAWVKRTGVGTWGGVLDANEDGGTGNFTDIYFFNDDRLCVRHRVSSSNAIYIETNRLFRDPNAWLHLCVAVDTTQSTSTDRVKIYINGVQETSFNSATYPSQNIDTWVNGAYAHRIGVSKGTGGGLNYFDGVLSHVHLVDGSALAPTVFGSTDSTTGEWQINTSPSYTVGTNGFFILKDGNSVTDQSANSNNFTVSNGTLSKTEDSPSNVFATLQGLFEANNNLTLSNGNTKAVEGSDNWRTSYSSLGASSGKFYCEAKITYQNNTEAYVGVAHEDHINGMASFGGSWGGVQNDGGYDYVGYSDKSVSIYSTGDQDYPSTVNVGDTWQSNGDIMSIAMDLDNNKVYFAKNGVWANGSGGWGSSTFDANTGGQTIVSGLTFFGFSPNQSTFEVNFGNGYFGTTQVSSAGTNASGIGIFEYDVPTGYTALSTKGLNE